MTIFCRICDRAIHSTKPDAQADVLVQMTNHLKTHEQQSIRLKESIMLATQLMAVYLMVKLYVKIPDEEKELLQSFTENEEQLIAIFGLTEATTTQEN